MSWRDAVRRGEIPDAYWAALTIRDNVLDPARGVRRAVRPALSHTSWAPRRTVRMSPSMPVGSRQAAVERGWSVSNARCMRWSSPAMQITGCARPQHGELQPNRSPPRPARWRKRPHSASEVGERTGAAPGETPSRHVEPAWRPRRTPPSASARPVCKRNGLPRCCATSWMRSAIAGLTASLQSCDKPSELPWITPPPGRCRDARRRPPGARLRTCVRSRTMSATFLHHDGGIENHPNLLRD